MEAILRKLTDKNDKTAYEFAKQLGVESVGSDRYLAMALAKLFGVEPEDLLKETKWFLRR